MNNQETMGPALIALLKGIISRDDQEKLWQQVLNLEAPIRDYLAVLGLDLVLAQDEGFAYLRNRQNDDGDGTQLPKLITRRPLSYPVSLLLALLRRRLAEHDASSHEPRLILDTREILDAASTFLPSGKTEARVLENLEANLKKVAELGFIRFLGTSTEKFEVKRILKAFVDAQWLAEFDQRLAEYRGYASEEAQDADGAANHRAATDRNGADRLYTDHFNTDPTGVDQ